jgi:hypothetical protein
MQMIVNLAVSLALNEKCAHIPIHIHRFLSIKWFVLLIVGKLRDFIQFIKSIQLLRVMQITRIIETLEIIEVRLILQIKLATAKWMEFDWMHVQDIDEYLIWPIQEYVSVLQSNEPSS